MGVESEQKLKWNFQIEIDLINVITIILNKIEIELIKDREVILLYFQKIILSLFQKNKINRYKIYYIKF